jgi:hypothetical protein
MRLNLILSFAAGSVKRGEDYAAAVQSDPERSGNG